jgi:sugar phosphate isomerase/epimerase
MMTRRDILRAAGPVSALLSTAPPVRAAAPPLRNFGAAPAGFPIHFRMAREAGKPFDFIDYCHELGCGAVETRIDPRDLDALRSAGRKAGAYGMRLILDIRLPRDAGELPAYETAVQAAKESGAIGMRAAMTPRRYEEWQTFGAFKSAFEQAQRTVERVEPVLRKHKLRLAIENHKGWRSAEQAAWMKRLGSEWVGVHFDFGNNLALCENPSQTLENLRPYVFFCHIKDMAVEAYDDGFLLAEVPLGEGFLDLKGMVTSLQAKDPAMPFDLEMITRDPLKIPVLTRQYWATFDDQFSPLPGRDLAAVLDIVRKNKPKSPLPRVTGMSLEAQLKLEDDNVARSVDYVRRNLNLA